MTRLVAQEVARTLGQPVVVENKPGASGTIGADLVAKAPADGHTLLVTNQLIVQAPNAIAKMPYDVMRDLTPVVELGGAPLILAVNASLPVKTAQELVAYAQQNRGKLSYAYGTPTVQIPAEAINRLNREIGEVLKAGDISLDRETKRVHRGTREIRLGPTEFRLLHFLMTHPERVHSRAQLLDQVWGDHVFVEERTVDVHIRRLRCALEPSCHDGLVQTVRGSGYRFSTQQEASAAVR